MFASFGCLRYVPTGGKPNRVKELFEAPMQQFSEDMPQLERAKKIAPLINELIESFYNLSLQIGVEDFQASLIERIDKAGLQETEVWTDPLKVGVAPPNREKQGIIPGDAQNLLRILTCNGFVKSKLELLAVRWPAGREGEEWKAFNKGLYEGADGLLGKLSLDKLELATLHGGHTTAAINIAKTGARGVHECFSIDGRANMGKIIAKQPSMKQAFEPKGLPYKVIDSNLIALCPKLAAALCRTGNASHGVHRVETSLAACKRIHEIIQEQPEGVTKEDVVKLASIGKLPGYEADAACYFEFTTKQSGGKDKQVIVRLEAYERTLEHKVKINPTNLRMISELMLPDAPNWVEGLCMAMLNAPPDFVQHEVAELFNTTDVSNLASRGKLRGHAADANNLWKEAEQFLAAYGRSTIFDEITKLKLRARLMVRSVMHVHNKKSQTREEYPSLLHIAKAWYDSAKGLDERLPEWRVLAPLANQPVGKAKSKAKAKVHLREIHEDGSIPNDELLDKGFEVGTIVHERTEDGEHAPIHTIVNLDDPLNVILEKVPEGECVDDAEGDGKDGTAENRVLVKRGLFLISWMPKTMTTEEVSIS